MPVTCQSAAELLHLIDLRSVRVVELVVRPASSEDPQEESAKYSITINFAQQSESLLTRFQMDLQFGGNEYRATVVTDHGLTQEIERLGDEVESDFITKVAIMAAYPYLRQSIGALAAMTESQVPLLGVLRQGAFEMRRNS